MGSGPTWKIPKTMTLKRLWEMIVQEANRRHVRETGIQLHELRSGGDFQAQEEHLNYTLEQLHVPKHLLFQISNGKTD